MISRGIQSAVFFAGMSATNAMAHHAEESAFIPWSHISEAIAVSVALLAISALVVLLLKTAR